MFSHRPFLTKVRVRASKEMARFIRPLFEPAARQYFQDFPFLYAFEIAGGNDLDGDYYEFGVFKGRSFVKAYEQARLFFRPERFKTMRFAAFDSFQGLPSSDEKFTPSGYFPGAFSASQEEFMRAVRRVPREQLHILPGYFSELTVPGRADVAALGDGKIAVCYIDCDVFEGCRDALNFITGRVQTGSMIIIDDWNRHNAIPGAGLRRAVQEWLERNPQIELTQIFVSKRVLFSVLVREPN